MVESIKIYDNLQQDITASCTIKNNKIIVSNSSKLIQQYYQIEFNFSSKIIAFRNHNYSWVGLNEDSVANDFSSKIIKLEKGTYVQANINCGVWQVKKDNPYQLNWIFNSQFLTPTTSYSGIKNSKKIELAHSNFDLSEDLALLFSNFNAVEISRSKIPFSAIACFTDHCDYDTLENLIIQRNFFKKINLKITKGFFLNHFSKRSDNASWQNDEDEFILWQNDGHELCYHSLSQSIKSYDESHNDFKSFLPPLTEIPVWIDHGFQPYNFSLYKNNSITNQDYEDILIEKKIKILWNYIDCGTASNGIINQLNPKQFTLKLYLESIKSEKAKSKIIKFIKAIIFHYDNDKNRIRNYIDSISAVKNLIRNKNPRLLIDFSLNVWPVFILILKTFCSWNVIKNTPYKAAKFSPTVFSHQIFNNKFYVFQTIEMVDFVNGLSKNNIDLLINESGMFIAHTYFSVDMKHHKGKFFKNKNTIDETVAMNFEYLSTKIANKSIWNPTLSELVSYYQDYANIVLDIDNQGLIFIKNDTTIHSRSIP